MAESASEPAGKDDDLAIPIEKIDQKDGLDDEEEENQNMQMEFQDYDIVSENVNPNQIASVQMSDSKMGNKNDGGIGNVNENQIASVELSDTKKNDTGIENVIANQIANMNKNNVEVELKHDVNQIAADNQVLKKRFEQITDIQTPLCNRDSHKWEWLFVFRYGIFETIRLVCDFILIPQDNETKCITYPIAKCLISVLYSVLKDFYRSFVCVLRWLYEYEKAEAKYDVINEMIGKIPHLLDRYENIAITLARLEVSMPESHPIASEYDYIKRDAMILMDQIEKVQPQNGDLRSIICALTNHDFYSFVYMQYDFNKIILHYDLNFCF